MCKTWNEVKSEDEEKWSNVFQFQNEDLFMDLSCPICNERQLHCYYDINIFENIEINNIEYIGRGGKWEWCSNCRSYLHYSCYVPKTWKIKIKIEEYGILTAEPEILEIVINKILNGTISIN